MTYYTEISVLYFMKYKPEAISLKMLPSNYYKHLDFLNYMEINIVTFG